MTYQVSLHLNLCPNTIQINLTNTDLHSSIRSFHSLKLLLQTSSTRYLEYVRVKVTVATEQLMHMAKHFDNFMKTLSLSMAQMGVSGERIENRNYSSSLVNETRELADAFDTKVITSRAYQLEMLEESIRGNTIVVV